MGFKDGVMVAIKDFNLKKHNELEKVRNLEVIKAMQSLKSRGYVRENFAWRHYYWYLTNEGIQYLRDFLHLPPEIVPATLRKATKPSESRSFSQRDQRGGPGGPPRDRDGGDRDAYRREGGRGGPPSSGGFGAPPPANAGGFGAPPPS